MKQFESNADLSVCVGGVVKNKLIILAVAKLLEKCEFCEVSKRSCPGLPTKKVLIKVNDCVMQIRAMNIKARRGVSQMGAHCSASAEECAFIPLQFCTLLKTLAGFSHLCRWVRVHWCALQPRTNNARPPRCQHSS